MSILFGFAFTIATGSVSLEIDAPHPEEVMGPIFVRTVRDRSTGCYINSLMRDPDQHGEVAFSLQPPTGEGSFRVTVESTGTLEPEVVDCVRKTLGGFYHYADKPTFDRLDGRLRYSPRMTAAPEPPTEALVRKMLGRAYAEGVVKMVGFKVERTSYDFL